MTVCGRGHEGWWECQCVGEAMRKFGRNSAEEARRESFWEKQVWNVGVTKYWTGGK